MRFKLTLQKCNDYKIFFTKKKKGVGYLNLVYNSGCVLEIKVLSMASQLCRAHIFGATYWQ